MRVRIIGSHGGISPGYRTSCYRINSEMLVDCGSAASGLSIEEQRQITDILITHPHLDHVKDIGFLIENTFRSDRRVLTLRSSKPILDDVHAHLLNDVLWPDFSRIHLDPKKEKQILQFSPLLNDQDILGIKVKFIPVNHTVNAVGFILDDGEKQVLFSGDTGPTEALWAEANKCSNLKAVFTEISFPNRMDALARASGHFTTNQLLSELGKLQNKEVPIYIAHFKPQFFDELMEEFHQSVPERIHLLHQDDDLEF